MEVAMDKVQQKLKEVANKQLQLMNECKELLEDIEKINKALESESKKNEVN